MYYLFNHATGNLLKQAKYFAPLTKSDILRMQEFVTIALVVLKIFKVVKSMTVLRAFHTKMPDVNRVNSKNGRAHLIGFSG